MGKKETISDLRDQIAAKERRGRRRRPPPRRPWQPFGPRRGWRSEKAKLAALPVPADGPMVINGAGNLVPMPDWVHDGLEMVGMLDPGRTW